MSKYVFRPSVRPLSVVCDKTCSNMSRHVFRPSVRFLLSVTKLVRTCHSMFSVRPSVVCCLFSPPNTYRPSVVCTVHTCIQTYIHTTYIRTDGQIGHNKVLFVSYEKSLKSLTCYVIPCLKTNQDVTTYAQGLLNFVETASARAFCGDFYHIKKINTNFLEFFYC